MSLYLPTGSSRSIELINKLERKKLARLSKVVIESLPDNNPKSLLTAEDVHKLISSGVGTNAAEVNLIVINHSHMIFILDQYTIFGFASDSILSI